MFPEEYNIQKPAGYATTMHYIFINMNSGNKKVNYENINVTLIIYHENGF
jgi:hypothetical protein